MTGPVTFQRRPTKVQAMQISASANLVSGNVDENTMSIASISGWMLGHGFHEFRVTDGPLFGLAVNVPGIGYLEAKAGWWIVLEHDGRFYPCSPENLESQYEAVDHG